MNKLSLAIIGFGNSARAFSKILQNNQAKIAQEYNTEVIVNAIATATRGCLYNKNGLALEELLNTSQYFDHPDYVQMTSKEILEAADYDVMIELTPLNIESGQPAIEYLKIALNRGKHVITANKGPLAHAYGELQSLANLNQVLFLYETTVMDGTPIFNLIRETLPYCKILGFDGILNTTTNFILEELENGSDFEIALEKGKKEGFVEANPTNDLAGNDAAAKTAVLINTLMNKHIKPEDIEYEGIIGITKEDVIKAKKENMKYKLICQASCADGIRASVKLQKVSLSHPLANINGTSSAITLHTDLMGSITIVENNPTIMQTGYGIFSDLLRIIKGT